LARTPRRFSCRPDRHDGALAGRAGGDAAHLQTVPAACPTGGAPAGSHGHSETDHQDPRRLRSQQVAVLQRRRLPKL